jgi:hypothetical protein
MSSVTALPSEKLKMSLYFWLTLVHLSGCVVREILFTTFNESGSLCAKVRMWNVGSL